MKNLFNFFDLFDFAVKLRSCVLRGLTEREECNLRNLRNLWTFEKIEGKIEGEMSDESERQDNSVAQGVRRFARFLCGPVRR
jgi:hypothetical protein